MTQPAGAAAWARPWVQLRHPTFHPVVFPSMLGPASPDAIPGALVHVYDQYGEAFGVGLYNPRAKAPLRLLRHGPAPAREEEFASWIDRAVDFRLLTLNSGADSDSYRVVNSDGDGLSGLIVDRFFDTLSVQVHSLGMAQRLPQFLTQLHRRLATTRAIVEVDNSVARIEGISPSSLPGDSVKSVKIREHGVRYELDFATGHKTGFFCDQRDNRRRFADIAKGRRVLDLCCYTGGFALAAMVRGAAAEATGVDLDEQSLAQARRNANLNNARIDWVHCDAYSYARQMKNNGQYWDLVVLDPPKMVHSRDEARAAAQDYEDLNALALTLVAPGGLFVSCSCSGLLDAEGFERLVAKAAHRLGRRLQFFERTGPAPDHPTLSNCPEGRYLKALWARAW